MRHTRLLPALAFLAPAPAAARPAALDDTAAEEAAWSCSLAIATYIVPDSHEYVQPTFRADLDAFHVEARYNYEALETASIFLGWNFSFGEDVTLDLTPMIGVVFGETGGVAPGLEATLGWRQIELYTEAEYVFDSHGRDGDFFYMWSEFSWYPVESFRVGLAAQRTRAYDNDVDIQRGPLIGFSIDRLELAAYAFGLDDGDTTLVFSATLNF